MSPPADTRPLVGIFGGSFNPPHLGHMRLAVEVLEALSPVRLDFLPTARPPHKGGSRILPFALRVAMLEAAIRGLDGLAVNTMESERGGLSYTSDTLRAYRDREPGFRHFFILGAEDFAVIQSWHEWRQLPELADLVIVPRAGSEVEVFTETVHSAWPEARPVTPAPFPANALYLLPEERGGGRIMHLPLPRLDIRAELVRERRRAGRSIRFLVPEAVEALLPDYPASARAGNPDNHNEAGRP
jgi:nicotinate-nucleotide adenylyltransferase